MAEYGVTSGAGGTCVGWHRRETLDGTAIVALQQMGAGCEGDGHHGEIVSRSGVSEKDGNCQQFSFCQTADFLKYSAARSAGV
jgi:hypothetical protein